MAKRKHYITGPVEIYFTERSYLKWDPEKGGEICTPTGCLKIPPEGPEGTEKYVEPSVIEFHGVRWALNTAYGMAKRWTGAPENSDEFAEAFKRALKQLLEKREKWEERVTKGIYEFLGIKPETVEEAVKHHERLKEYEEYYERLKNKMTPLEFAKYIRDREAYLLAPFFERDYGCNPLTEYDKCIKILKGKR